MIWPTVRLSLYDYQFEVKKKEDLRLLPLRLHVLSTSRSWLSTFSNSPNMTPSLQQHTPSPISSTTSSPSSSSAASHQFWSASVSLLSRRGHFHSFKLSLSSPLPKCVNISLLLLPTSCRLQRDSIFLIFTCQSPSGPPHSRTQLSETSINSSLFCIMASSWRNLIFRHSACFTHGWPMDPNTHNSFFSLCLPFTLNLSCLPNWFAHCDIYYLINDIISIKLSNNYIDI